MSATAVAILSATSVLGAGSAYVGHEMMQDHPEISGNNCVDMSGIPLEDAFADPSVSSIQQAIMDKAGIEIIGGADGDFGQASCIAFGLAQEALGVTVDYKFGPESAGALGIDLNNIFPNSDLASDADAVEGTQVSVPTTEDIECRNMDGVPAESGYTNGAILQIQTALDSHGYGRGGVDGKFLDLTCDEVVAFQRANNLTVDGIVGPATARALGINYESLVSGSIASQKEFEPEIDCPAASSCDIEVNLNTQRLHITDGSGNIIWDRPVQSGKRGYETRNIRSTLGHVEYGEGGNPERPSVDYPEAILVNPRGFGNGGQKFHGSYSFNAWAVDSPDSGSAGCVRLEIGDSYTFAKMPIGTSVLLFGAKPGTTQR